MRGACGLMDDRLVLPGGFGNRRDLTSDRDLFDSVRACAAR